MKYLHIALSATFLLADEPKTDTRSLLTQEGTNIHDVAAGLLSFL